MPPAFGAADLVKAIEQLKLAVEARELGEQIEDASVSLKGGFKR